MRREGMERPSKRKGWRSKAAWQPRSNNQNVVASVSPGLRQFRGAGIFPRKPASARVGVGKVAWTVEARRLGDRSANLSAIGNFGPKRTEANRWRMFSA